MNTIRPELLTLSSVQLNSLLPYFWVFAGIILALLGSVLRIVHPKWPVFLITLATCIVGIFSSLGLIHSESLTLFNGGMVADPYSNFFNIVFLASAGFTALTSLRYLDKEGLQHPEYFVLLLLAAFGMMVMASSLDLIVLFIALEIMSLPVYVLVGFRRADKRSNEAAMKYFILGSAASAALLYGSALLYGCSGSTEVRTILSVVQAGTTGVTPIFALGLGLVVFGFLFKVAAVPFHMWMPDVYEGAPAPVTGFMTTGLKAAAFAAFIRIFTSLVYGKDLSQLALMLQGRFHDILWVAAVLTMVVGNFVALSQTNLKRMLAYSSIAHTGYLLIGLISGPGGEMGFAPSVVYIVVYAVMNLGAFVVLTLLAGRSDTGLSLQDLSGMSQRHPWLAFSMAVFILSMAGIPPTAGFAAKYLLFYSAIQANEIPLVIIAVLCSAVSVYYYLRVLVYIYMRDPVGSPPGYRVSVWSGLAVATMVIMVLQIGVVPGRLFEVAKRVVASVAY